MNDHVPNRLGWSSASSTGGITGKLQLELPAGATVSKFEFEHWNPASQTLQFYPATPVPAKKTQEVLYKEREKGRSVAAASLSSGNKFEIEIFPLPYQEVRKCRVWWVEDGVDLSLAETARFDDWSGRRVAVGNGRVGAAGAVELEGGIFQELGEQRGSTSSRARLFDFRTGSTGGVETKVTETIEMDASGGEVLAAEEQAAGAAGGAVSEDLLAARAGANNFFRGTGDATPAGAAVRPCLVGMVDGVKHFSCYVPPVFVQPAQLPQDRGALPERLTGSSGTTPSTGAPGAVSESVDDTEASRDDTEAPSVEEAVSKLVLVWDGSQSQSHLQASHGHQSNAELKNRVDQLRSILTALPKEAAERVSIDLVVFDLAPRVVASDGTAGGRGEEHSTPEQFVRTMKSRGLAGLKELETVLSDVVYDGATDLQNVVDTVLGSYAARAKTEPGLQGIHPIVRDLFVLYAVVLRTWRGEIVDGADCLEDGTRRKLLCAGVHCKCCITTTKPHPLLPHFHLLSQLPHHEEPRCFSCSPTARTPWAAPPSSSRKAFMSTSWRSSSSRPKARPRRL